MHIKLLLILLVVAIIGFGAVYFVKSYTDHKQDVLGSSSGGQNITTQVKDGYSYTNVKTNYGTFGVYVYKTKLSDVTVKTVAANPATCTKDCPTKPLKQYVAENNAIAAINGTYFCPPDYASCKSKKNSFDFAFYNSNKKVWLNKNALTWNKTAAVMFKGNKAQFCMDITKCSSGGVTAGLSNYPGLVQDQRIVVDKGDIQPYQKQKGMKGFIGSDGTNLYLALVSNVTITEVAYVARAMGMTNALNIDGGGSSALYVGGAYKVGPGRLLPNAVVITK